MERYFPQKGEIYRHMEGGRYVIMALARESGTGSEMVVYQNVEKEEEVFVCPVGAFMQKTEETSSEFVLETEQMETEQGRSLILDFLEISDAQEKMRFLQRHRGEITGDMLSVIAESLEFAETETENEFRFEAILKYLQTIARYEGRRK